MCVCVCKRDRFCVYTWREIERSVCMCMKEGECVVGREREIVCLSGRERLGDNDGIDPHSV